jgi:Na+-transporting methylmalonyl-CoA/oxaloacetate decarboxylase gamma subunit
MLENLILVLQITLVGMGLVFGAILLLWGVMALLVRLAPERTIRQEEPSLSSQEDLPEKTALQAQTAAIAVSIALAQTSASEPQEFPLPPTALVSPWQGVMRTKMLNKRGPVR